MADVEATVMPDDGPQSRRNGSRVVLVDKAPDDPVVAQVFERFATEDREPIALYRALANTPLLLRAYGTFAMSVRYETTVDRHLQELVVLRIAQLTGSRYEWAHHRPVAAQHGVGDEDLAELERWATSERFDARARAVLRLADEVHAAALSSAAFDEVRRLFGEARAVELLVVAAFYEAVARIIQGLDIEVEPEYSGYLDPGQGDDDA